VKRRIRLGWAAFGKLKLIFKSKMNNSLKRKVFDSCVLPVLTYGAKLSQAESSTKSNGKKYTRNFAPRQNEKTKSLMFWNELRRLNGTGQDTLTG